MKKGSILIAEVLSLCMKAKTARDVFETLGCDERVARLIIWELNESGLLERVGERRPPTGGNASVLYQTRFVDGEVFGRPFTRRVIGIWNALIEPDSTENIALDVGMSGQTARRVVKRLHAARLCRIAGWQRNRISIPTAIYVLGRGPDAARPAPMTMKEYNARATQNRKKRQVSDAIFGMRKTAANCPLKEAA